MDHWIRGGRLSWGLLVLGGLGGAALVGAAWLDFGDPGAALEQRVAHAAVEESQWIQRAWDRLCEDSALPAEPRGDVLRVPLPAADAHVASDNGTRDDDAGSALGPVSVFSTLFRAGLAQAAAGDRPAALARVREALAVHGHGASSAERAEARLRELAWAHAEGDFEGERAARAHLLREAGGEQRGTVPYALLAALAGSVDEGLLADLWSRLARRELPFAPEPARVRFSGGEIRTFLGPRDVALVRALADRAPDLDWERALGLDAARAAALLAAVPALEGGQEGRWRWLPWPVAAPDGEVSPWVLAQRLEGNEGKVVALARADVAAALGARAAAGGEGTARADLFELRIAPEAALLSPDDARVLGPEPLGEAGLVFDLLAPRLAREIAAERRRLVVVRAGLVGLGLLVALAAVLSARALARERRLAELRSTFVAGVSHDLRTPLASILLLVENLERGAIATDAARRRYHGALRQEAERLLRMVNDLLDASRVERGAGPRIAAAPVALGPFLDDLEHALAERAAQAGASLGFSRHALPGDWVLDAEAVRRAVWNLFENALRHGRSADGSARVEIEVHAVEAGICVEVRDHGPGIPARHRESVFRPFVRAVGTRRSSSTMDDLGTGLGLSIVRAIARAHGGDAEVVPSPDGAHLRLLVGTAPPDEGESVA
ncbi:MAG: hypothetical protein GC161_15755 [Planctomycetaceae bacterium]|nr:hypothetical protein [Planctomycetaceae bacterium]